MTSEQAATELSSYLSAAQIVALLAEAELHPDPATWLATVVESCRCYHLHLLL